MHSEVAVILASECERDELELALADLLEPYGDGSEWDFWSILDRPDAIRRVSEAGEVVPFAWVIDDDAYGDARMPAVAPHDQVPSGWIAPDLFTGRRFIPNPDFPSWSTLRPYLDDRAWVVLLDCHN